MDIVNQKNTVISLTGVERKSVELDGFVRTDRESDSEHSDELENGVPMSRRKKKVVWSASVTVDPMSEFMDEIKELRAVTQKAYDSACDSVYYGREEGNQHLSWNEAYHRTLRPTAQRVLELVRTFPSEATFEQKKVAIKIALGITRKALVAANAGKDVEHEEMLEQDLEDAWNYFQKSPKEMGEYLAGHQFVNQWNQEALERLQTLLNEAQAAQGISRQKVRTLLGWIRPEKEVLPSQEEINFALQQQQVIDHAVTTCEQALTLAGLLQSMSGNKFSEKENV
eukprot:gene13821-15240_t